MRALVLISLLYGCSLFAQPAATVPPAQPLTDQQIAGIFNSILQHEARISPMLDQVRPAGWIAKGAPETYVAQLSSVQQQIRTIETDMTDLEQHPDRMTDCMRALFRAQAFHQVLGSLLGGLRKYQNPALADLIESVAAEDRTDLVRLQNYILDLASQKEQQYALVDREAQRCRATLANAPPSTQPAARRATRTQ